MVSTQWQCGYVRWSPTPSDDWAFGNYDQVIFTAAERVNESDDILLRWAFVKDLGSSNCSLDSLDVQDGSIFVVEMNHIEIYRGSARSLRFQPNATRFGRGANGSATPLYVRVGRIGQGLARQVISASQVLALQYGSPSQSALTWPYDSTVDDCKKATTIFQQPEGIGAIGCRCTDGADGGTEASAEDDVVAISAISDTTVVKKDKNRLEDSRKKLVACARALRARLAKEQADVWKKAEAEFNVQKMIWQSLSLQRGAKHQGTAAMIESKLEFAMQSHTKNLTAAVEALDACVQRNEGLDLLGVAMIESIEAIKRSAAHADSRQELAALLDKAAEEIGSGVVSRRGADLINLLASCGIQEAKLESAIKAAWTAAYD